MAGINDDVRRALELINAWRQFDPDGPKPRENFEVFAAVLMANVAEPEGARELVMGLVRLTDVLLQNIETNTGHSPEVTLRMVSEVLTRRDGGETWT